MSDQKRLLADLRVIDLRAELEKRNLNKSGVRGVLIQRLAKYLEENGEDPATFKFDLSGSETKSSPTKSTRHSDSLAESKSEETPAMEDMIVQDDTGEEEETQSNSVASQSIVAMEAKPTDDNESMDSEPKEKAIRTLGMDDSEASPAKKPCLDKEDDNKTETNMDSEDSINLDLGEDELLNEETESTTIPKKDDGSIGYAAGTAGDDSPHDNAAAATDTEPAGDQANAEAAATSVDGDSAEQEPKDDRHKSAGDKKDKDESKEGGARNLWVSGLSGDTRAKDLKQLCSKHGKVIGAKVVTNAKTPGSRCYGYLTMASSQDAENCIKHLHRTELHGRMISVEKAKSESESSSRRHPHRPENEKADDKSKNNGEESNRSISRTRDKSSRSERERGKRSTRSRERKKSPKDALSFAKIAKERDLARIRERSRLAREDERRRRAAEEALRERERRQRQERHRLQLERDKLREEREKIEREKNELLRLERDRHRFEREKLELERLELKRAQLRLEEERRKRSYEGSSYRKPGSPPQPAYERHKRAPPPMSSGRQFEAPPPPRFEVSSSYDRGADKRDRDYKRDYPRHVSSSNVKYPANGNCNDDTRQPLPPGTRPKEPSRSYESRDNRSYRPSPTAKPEPRNWSASSRYPDTTTAAKGRSGGGSGEAWSGGEQRYSGAAFPARYPAYQPPPPGAAYPDRYANREYRKY